MKKRTRLEVIRDILEILRENKQTKITHLIYKSNLSNNSIKPYLKDLLENGMIEQTVSNEKREFKIASKGHVFLEEFNKIKIFSESFGL